jgi:hypothetical protein
MRAFLASVAIAVVLAGGAAAILIPDNRTAYQAFTSGGARIADPGHNLVGENWRSPGRG